MAIRQNFATMCVHVGSEPDPLTGAVVPPISLATTFAQNGLGQLHGLDHSNSHERGFEYSRTGNPTRGAFERAIAAVEHGEYGIAFASGLVWFICCSIKLMRKLISKYCLTRVSYDQAATNAIIQTLASSDHVLCIDDVYGGTQRYRDNNLSVSL